MLKPKSYNTCLTDGTFNNIRKYGKAYSVTTVLKILDLGNELNNLKTIGNIDEILKKAATRGTNFHNSIEDLFKNNKFTHINPQYLNALLLFIARNRKAINFIDFEQQLTDNKVGGRYDAYCTRNKIPTIIDWKTGGQRMYPELLFKYKLQISKYIQLKSLAINKDNNIDISIQGKIVVFKKNSSYEIITVTNEEAKEYIEMYNNIYNTFIQYLTKFNAHKRETSNS